MAARVLLAIGVAILAAAACRSAPSGGAISMVCGGVGMQFEMCRRSVDAWSRRTGHPVTVVSTPESSSEKLALFQQLLAARSRDIDVFSIDVIWPGILGSHFIDLADRVPEAERAQHLAVLVANNTVDGRLVALPWFADAGLLYYRADLLEKHGRAVPATWAELTDTAAFIQQAERAAGASRLWGFVWQGRAYEGLVCNALEWVSSFGGGTFVDEHGRITANNPSAARALELAARWVGTISPPGVLNYGEEDARGVFQSGNAVFMRNWPYAWQLAQSADSPIRGKVGMSKLPSGGRGGPHAASLGGWQLAVSRYSERPDLSTDLVRHLTSRQEQKVRAIAAAFLPTRPALYEDAEVLAAQPFYAEMENVLGGAVARPSNVIGFKYNQFASVVWTAVHATLEGRGDARSNLARLEARLEHLSRGGRW